MSTPFSTRGTVSSGNKRHIWGDRGYRVFLSHKSAVKKEAAELKESLRLFGVSAFVAHADIRPTKAWQDEIENALVTMHAFVALMTEDFHRSEWTDQEVGFAVARNVPTVAVNLGRNPYGFIGKFQALSCTWETAPLELVGVLIKHERMMNAYAEAVGRCGSFDAGNTLAQVLPAMEHISDEHADALIAAFNENHEVFGSFGFNGAKPGRFGDGLLAHLRRANDRTYKELRSGKIKVAR